MTTGFDDELAAGDPRAVSEGRYAGLGEDESGSPGWGTSYTGPSKPAKISRKKPFVLSRKFADPFYFNGPRTDPWNHHSAQIQQVQAATSLYSDERQAATLNYFQRLLNRYGATNSPGTIWALAQSGLSVESDTIQKVLEEDSKASQSSGTTAIAAEAFDAGTEDGEGSDGWAPVEWLSRNAFAALSMPQEGFQSGFRNMLAPWMADAELNPQYAGMNAGEKFGQSFLSGVMTVAPPLAAILDGLVVDDESFQNPWEQTNFGQTMLSAMDNPENFLNPFNPAYNEQQAGLNFDEAETLLLEDPRYQAEREVLMSAAPEQQGKIRDELLTNIAQSNDLYGGPGWFIDETSEIGENERSSVMKAWTVPIPGDETAGWTPGRGITGGIAGTEYSGYNFVSGLIDAVAVMAGDPAVFASKLALPSKALKGISGGKVLVGTAGREARAAMGTRNRGAQNLLEEWNRLAASDEGLFAGKTMTAEEWADLDGAAQAAMVRQMREAQAAERSLATATPDIDLVEQRARDLRRSAAQASRADVALGNAWENVTDLSRTGELWEEMDQAVRLAAFRGKDVPKVEVKPTTTTVAGQVAEGMDEIPFTRTPDGLYVTNGYTISKSGKKWTAVGDNKDEVGEFKTLAEAKAAVTERRYAEQGMETWTAKDGVETLGGYTISVNDEGRAVLSSSAGEQLFASVDQAKAVVAKARPVAAEETVDEVIAQVVYSEKKYKQWFNSLDEYDQFLFKQSIEDMRRTFAKSVSNEDPNWRALLFNKAVKYYQNRVAKASKKPQKADNAKNANADAVYLYLDDAAEAPLEELRNIDTAGATSAGDFMPRPDGKPGWAPQRAVVDGQDVLLYWTGKEAPKVLDSSTPLEMVPAVGDQPFAVALSQYLTTLFDRTDGIVDLVNPTIKVADDELDRLPGQVAERLRVAENPLTEIQRILDNGQATVQQVFLMLAKTGLDGFFDDWLRTQGWDALGGVNRKTRSGLWFGDNPLLEAYRWPADAVDNARMAGGMPDGVDAFLSALPKTAQRVDLNGMSVDDLSRFMSQADEVRRAKRKTRVAENQTAIEIARAAQLSLDDEIDSIVQRFDDPARVLKEIFQYEAGVGMNRGSGITVDPQGLRWFLFGSGPLAGVRAKALRVMANVVSETDRAKFRGLAPDSDEFKKVMAAVAPRYLGQINQAVGKKWDPETIKAVFMNSINEGGEEGLLKALAPRLGIDVQKGSLPLALKSSDQDGMRYLKSFRTTEGRIGRAVRRMESLRPGSRMVAIDNAEEVIDAVVKYGIYAKIPDATIQKYVGQIILNDGEFAASAKNVDVLKRLFNDINDSLVKKLDESTLLYGKGVKAQARKAEVARAITDSTRLFLAGETGMKTDNAVRMATGSDIQHYVDDLGNRVDMPGIQLDSELLAGFINLPNVDEWGQVINRVNMAVYRNEKIGNVYEFARGVYDNFFRTGMLVFRAAYVLRNSAEMQVRLFLNGHHSVFNDPFTMMGMTMGNFALKGKRGSKLHSAFAPYHNTVLDTSFEVGNDELAALSNHVEDYFAITREANSLTDPRVYQSAVKNGWEVVGFDSPHFVAGWSNELITLNRSPLAKAVLGTYPQGSTARGADSVEQTVNWIMSDDTVARSIRERLIAADETYSQIFASPALTRDYLFDSPNSISNRIRQFTLDGDPILTDFIKTGVWKGDGLDFTLNTVPRLQDRVKQMQGALRARFYKDASTKDATKLFMDQAGTRVPWVSDLSSKRGTGLFDWFFQTANKFERLNTVGPEFRMAYWDRIAELAPGLRADDVDRAMKGAETTLRGIKRMMPDKKIAEIGPNHPAWDALQKAKANGNDGLLTLDDIHGVAMEYAAKEVQGLFYDAARRNNFWASTRLLFPFGQAWGNTLKMWGELGARRPINIYKAQKVFNGAMEEGSGEAIYESPMTGWMYGDYADGMAPWDADPNGGFVFQNSFGDYNFGLPLMGKALGAGIEKLAKINGIDTGPINMDVMSDVTSLNLAVGQEALWPGSSFILNTAIDMLPDSQITELMKNVSAPFGQKGLPEAAIPAWGQKSIAGVGAIPVIGDGLAGFISGLAPSMKNRNVVDASAILMDTGRYNLDDAQSVSQLREDAKTLGASFTLINGFAQNISPSTPIMEAAVELDNPELQGAKAMPGMTYSLGMFGRLYQQYLEEASGDSVEAKSEMLRDFGPAAVYAVTGNKDGYQGRPSSQARNWTRESRENHQIARAYPEQFYLFFPEGDSTDVTASMWLEDMAGDDREYKTAEQVVNDNIMWMIRIQRQMVDNYESADQITSEQADAKRLDITESYRETEAGMQFSTMTATKNIQKIRAMFEESPSLQKTQAGVAFGLAYEYRDQALAQARKAAKDPSKTLGGDKSAAIREAYYSDLEGLLAEYPQFKQLYRVLTEEFE